MADEKKTILLTNKGKRPWDLVDASGVKKHIEYLGTIEMEEAKALRMILDYPKDFTQQGVAGPSSKDLARMEQSLRDRTANLDAREAALDEREKALEAREKASGTDAQDETKETTAKKAGRPPKTDKAE